MSSARGMTRSAHSTEVDVRPHRPSPRLCRVRREVMAMARPDMLGNQQFDQLPDELVAAVSEHPLGGAVDQHEHALAIAHHDTVGRRVEQRPEGNVPVKQHRRS
jgi:hypothetical protein